MSVSLASDLTEHEIELYLNSSKEQDEDYDICAGVDNVYMGSEYQKPSRQRRQKTKKGRNNHWDD